jgi:hypothetical protein
MIKIHIHCPLAASNGRGPYCECPSPVIAYVPTQHRARVSHLECTFLSHSGRKLERDEQGMATEAVGRGARWRHKCWQWCRRYLPAELTGTVCAFIGTTLICGIFADRTLAAFAGTLSENVGFYGVLAVFEWQRQHTAGQGPLRTTVLTARLLIAEFGLIELLDSTLLRPLFLYVGPELTGGLGSGTLLGKVMADATFYLVAIASSELFRRRTSAALAALAHSAAPPGGRSAA